MNIGEENLKKTADRLGLTIEQIPRSIAIIMDGNGRWAQQKGLLRVAGHHKGGKTVEQIVLDCVDLGIEVLTMYTFSIENWKRPKAEVNALMKLYTKHLVGIRNVMMENNVRLIHLGRSDNLPKSLKAELDKSVEMTTGNDGMVLGLALNYGGRSEIVDAAKKIAQQYKDSKLSLDDIDQDCISKNLYTSGLRDPDLLIRTAGERRVSNFLLWQISYSEFYVTKTFWPDFERADLEKAILDYAQRSRRFGSIKK